MLALFTLVAIGGHLGPEGVKVARWIWYPEVDKAGLLPAGERFSRKTFVLEERPAFAECFVTADNSYVLFVNGEKVGGDDLWQTMERYDVTRLLRRGRNTIAVKCRNFFRSAAGLLLLLKARLPDGTEKWVVSDGSWRCSREPQKGWERHDFDDRGWTRAATLGRVGDPPWGIRFGHASLFNEIALSKLVRAQLRLREVNIIPAPKVTA